MLRIFFEPADALPNLRSWLGSHYSFVPQTGRDLGEKMKNAFIHGFAEGFSKLVLIGSDLPDLPADFLKQGLHALDTHDAVIGPSSDGGYYLIGFTKDAFLPKTFKNIPWGQTNVFQRTMNILEQHPKTTHILPQWHDVDTLGDLKSLCLRYEQSSLDQSRTATFLRKQLGSRSHV
ncbi:MAG: TIGR04282 family arsenosugar biosynthesis glycosyltransferase [Planctomycetota bacterium]|jgi:rSAM/selenodomain-associated transferase 1